MDDRALEPDDLLADDRLTTVGLLAETNARLRSAYEADLEPYGLAGSAFEVLIRLGRSPDRRLRMSDLAAKSTLSNSGLTRVVDRLLAAGLVDRVRHDRDRRVTFAVLTPLGLDRLCRALPTHLATIDAAINEVLTEQELAALTAALAKIHASVPPTNA